MARYEVRLKRQLRVDTQTLEAGTLVATVECDLPLRMAASLILGRGIVVGEQLADFMEIDDVPTDDLPVNKAAAESRPPAEKAVAVIEQPSQVGKTLTSDVDPDATLWALLPAYAVKAFASADVHSLDDAREYHAKHGSFEPLPEIGKKRAADLAVMLSLG